MRRAVFVLMLTMATLCRPGPAASAPTAAAEGALDSLRAASAWHRARKDSAFAWMPDSPIPAAELAAFTGLRYFPYDPAYRVPVALHAFARRRIIRFPATDGTGVEVERYGLAAGELAGESFRLLVIRARADAALEIFFTDPTNGTETYGAGRYVQLERQADGSHVLDFNAAYNPYCAYNQDFVCPLPPADNHLSTPVRAGEQAYRADPADSW